MADHRTARTGAKPSLTTLVALTALALGLPGGDALADKQSSGPGVAEIASAIERGIVTVQEGVVSWYGAQFHDRQPPQAASVPDLDQSDRSESCSCRAPS